MYTVIATYETSTVRNENVPSYELALALRDRHYGNGAVAVEFRRQK